MPLENGIQFDFGNVCLCNGGGELVCKFTGVQEFDDMRYTEDSGDETWGRIDCNREYSFTCYYAGARRAMKKIMYGWSAKGPIRCRVLENLRGIKRRKCNEDRR